MKLGVSLDQEQRQFGLQLLAGVAGEVDETIWVTLRYGRALWIPSQIRAVEENKDRERAARDDVLQGGAIGDVEQEEAWRIRDRQRAGEELVEGEVNFGQGREVARISLVNMKW